MKYVFSRVIGVKYLKEKILDNSLRLIQTNNASNPLWNKETNGLTTNSPDSLMATVAWFWML
jgi:hypothetical protein